MEVFTVEEIKKKKNNFKFFWRNDKTSDSSSYSYGVPTQNPIGSNIVCWNNSKLKNLVFEVSDKTLLNIPENIGEFISFKVLGKGNISLTIYTKDNPFDKKIIDINLD